MVDNKKNKETNIKKASDYTSHVIFHSPREQVFNAIATLEGLRGWWTTLVKGSTKVGDEIRFEFEGLEEYIIMRVEKAEYPSHVAWTCIIHTDLPEWKNTRITFDLIEKEAGECELHFCHIGLTPKLVCYGDCKQGWDYFLESLVNYVETGKGTPFGI